jgi:ubiquinone/menaquinone biosynthesis C-methylase UbiE
MAEIIKNKFIQHNIKLHDEIASAYDLIHNEIYNHTEQLRIHEMLQFCIDQIQSSKIEALDFGAGTGNLTKHLLDLDVITTASDVSRSSLNTLLEKFPNEKKLFLKEINGQDLSCFNSNTFDLVVTYSVLHHVPDYLSAVNEMIRVLKPGGIIYIDHELCPSYWEHNNLYNSYMSELQELTSRSFYIIVKQKLKKLFSLSAWFKLYNRVFRGLNEEGDIHTTKDDHIEWGFIEDIVNKSCSIIKVEDYLVCRELSPEKPIHSKFYNKCSDMRMLIAKKI